MEAREYSKQMRKIANDEQTETQVARILQNPNSLGVKIKYNPYQHSLYEN
jgi:hypothetical protein